MNSVMRRNAASGQNNSKQSSFFLTGVSYFSSIYTQKLFPAEVLFYITV